MSEPYESLAVEVKGYVAQVTLLGPGKGNAMGPAFWEEMPVVFGELDADPEVRAIVLTGSGRNFSYGLDLMAMGAMLPSAGGDPSAAPARTSTRSSRGCRVDQRSSRLPHPHHRLGARLVHRRRRRPDFCGRHPLRQRRRQVLGA